MKSLRVFCPLLILLSLALSGPAPAADLEAGWYAWPFSVQVIADDGSGCPYLRASGWFTTPPGTHGLFTVAGGPYGDTGWRKATVTSNAYGAGPADSLLLPMGFGMTIGERFMYISISWGTDYNASQMQLELWRNRYGGTSERIWTQSLSGTQSGMTDLLYGGEFEGTFFYKVAVVPEPSAVLSLGCLATLTIVQLWRRRKR
jgi:hypothetical protein